MKFINKKYSLNYYLLFLFFIGFFFYLFFYTTNSHITVGIRNMSRNSGLSTDFAANFCKDNSGGKSEQACSNLTRNNCMQTSCCIWTNRNRCAAGDKSGLKFRSQNPNRNDRLSFYFFRNKCYGRCRNNQQRRR